MSTDEQKYLLLVILELMTFKINQVGIKTTSNLQRQVA
jgi:hypothetical protein